LSPRPSGPRETFGCLVAVVFWLLVILLGGGMLVLAALALANAARETW